MGVESAAGGQMNYDDIKFVYENQERSALSEKPVPTIKKSIEKPPMTFSQQRAFQFDLNPTKSPIVEKKKKFDLREVKEYLDSLEDYEKSKKKNEITKDDEEEPKGCVSSTKCLIF